MFKQLGGGWMAGQVIGEWRNKWVDNSWDDQIDGYIDYEWLDGWIDN